MIDCCIVPDSCVLLSSWLIVELNCISSHSLLPSWFVVVWCHNGWLLCCKRWMPNILKKAVKRWQTFHVRWRGRRRFIICICNRWGWLFVDCLLTVLFLMLMVLLMPLVAYAAIVYEFVLEPSEFEPEPSEAQVDTVNSADSWRMPQYSPPISMSRETKTTFLLK